MDDDDEGLDEGKPPTVSDEVLEKLDIDFTAREIHLRACQASWNGAQETRTDSRHWL